MNDRRLPHAGLSVFIRKNGTILLGKRIKPHGMGTWHPPGGYLEMFESWEEGGRREVREEVGLELKNVRFMTATNDIFSEEGRHYVTIFLVADWKEGEVRNLEPDKHEGWGWFAWNDLPEPLFLPVGNFLKRNINPLEF